MVDASVHPPSVRAELYFLSSHGPLVGQEQVGTVLHTLCVAFPRSSPRNVQEHPKTVLKFW